MSSKVYWAYRNSDVDFAFTQTFLQNRGQWTVEMQEIADNCYVEIDARGYGHMAATWEYYNRMKEMCLSANEYRGIAAREEDERRAAVA